MKRLLPLLFALIAAGCLLAAFVPAQSPSATTTRVWRPVKGHPAGGHFVHFKHIDHLRKGREKQIADALATDPLKAGTDVPIDWAGKLDLPMDLNDRRGCLA